MPVWLLLTYTVPRHPSARRVYVWRKLKRLGAVALQDAVWTLPLTGPNREQFQWLAAEVSELGGEAMVWEGKTLSSDQETVLVGRFEAVINEPYQRILKELKKPKRDLAALSSEFQKVQSQDYFQSRLGQRVRRALLSARGGPTR